MTIQNNIKVLYGSLRKTGRTNEISTSNWFGIVPNRALKIGTKQISLVHDEDTLLDLHNYAAMALLLLQEQEAKEAKEAKEQRI